MKDMQLWGTWDVCDFCGRDPDNISEKMERTVQIRFRDVPILTMCNDCLRPIRDDLISYLEDIEDLPSEQS